MSDVALDFGEDEPPPHPGPDYDLNGWPYAGSLSEDIDSCVRTIEKAEAGVELTVLFQQTKAAIEIAQYAGFDRQAVLDRLYGAAERIGLTAAAGDDRVTETMAAAVDDVLAAESEAGAERREEKKTAGSIQATPFVWRDPLTIPTRQWLYGRHLIRKFSSATVGAGGAGKSALLVTESLENVSGKPIFRLKTPHAPLRVWYWNLEDPRDEIERRVMAACLHYGLGPDDLGDRLMLDSGRDQPCVVAEMTKAGTIIRRPLVDQIIEQVRLNRIDILRIDPFVSCHQVPENDNGAIDAVAKLWGLVADKGNIAVELAHHTRKLGDGDANAESSRGAKALVDACRSVRVLNGMKAEEAERAGLENHRLFFRLSTDKLNLAPPSDKAEWVQMVSTDLGNGGAGPSDHVGVAVRWEWPDAFDGVTARDLRVVQQRIAGGEWRADQRAAEWVGKAVADVLEIDISDRAGKSRVAQLVKTWVATGALRVDRRADDHRKEREFIVVDEWATQ